MKIINFISELFRKYPGLCLANVFLNIAMSLFAVCSLFSLSPIIDIVIHPDKQGISPLTQKTMAVMGFVGIPVSLANCLVVFFILVTISCVLQILGSWLTLQTTFAVVRDVLNETFKDFFNAGWQFFSSGEQGTLYNTFSRELGKMGDAFSALGRVFAAIIQVGILLTAPFVISWKITLISFAAGLAGSSFFILLGNLAYKLGQRNTMASNKLTAVIYESISGAKLVLGYGNQKRVLKDTDEAFKDTVEPTLQSQVLSYSILIAYRPLGVIVVAIVIISSKWFSVPFADVTILLLALFQVMITLGNLISQKNMVINFVPSYEQIIALRKKAQAMRQPTGQRLFSGFSKEISVQGLSFSHPGNMKILDGINLVIPKGKMVAFVGKSGAGKSTMIDMLMGFHQPESGDVLIDGVNLFDYDICSYRHRLGYVPQESRLFNMSIRDNLLWSVPQASFQEIEDACRQAYADEFIVQMPNKYETVVGDRGVRLSGGQIQRLALARAFLRKPEILILDEATSSLDSQSEQLIQKAIEDFAKKTTVIVVAHRLTTIKKADIIYVLNGGRVSEQGSYGDLTDRNGIFSGMIQLQELGFK